jgi:hypothetical protein
MAWLRQHDARRAHLEDAAGIHDRNAVSDLRDNGEIVRDIDHRNLALTSEAHQFAEHSRLRDHIEASGWLVQHDDRRFAGERERDARALLLPPDS